MRTAHGSRAFAYQINASPFAYRSRRDKAIRFCGSFFCIPGAFLFFLIPLNGCATSSGVGLSIDRHGELAARAMRDGDFERAAEQYEELIRYQPDDAPAFANLARAYHRLALTELAEAFYLEAVRLDPHYQPALEGLCRLAIQTDKPKAAEYYLSQLKQADPKSPHLEELIAQFPNETLPTVE